MKKAGLILLLGLFLSVFAATSVAWAADDLNVCYPGDASAPNLWNYLNEDVSFTGFNVDLLNSIERIDSSFHISSFGWENELQTISSLGSSSENVYQLVLPVGEKEISSGELGEEYRGDIPYVTVVPVLFVSEESGIASVQDLAGKNVAFYPERILENLGAYNTAHPDQKIDCTGTALSDDFTHFDSELGSKYAAAILSADVAASLLQNEEMAGFTIKEIPDADQLGRWDYWIYYMPCLKDYGLYRAQTEENIRLLAEEGTYATLTKKYFGIDLTEYYLAAVRDARGETVQEGVYTDKETILKVQQALIDHGYPCGTPDGIAGGLTSQAILDFKKSNGIEDGTDQITDVLLATLGIS